MKGSLPFASLTSALLVKANEGNVYNITDAFTSTANFVEGAGKKYSAGSNVVVVETTTAVFTVSTDNTVDAGKTYYIHQNGGYSAVTPAQAQTLLQGEIDALAESRMDSTLNIADEAEVRRRELAREEECRILTDDSLQRQIDALSESRMDSTLNIADEAEVRRRELAREEQCRITTDDALQRQINTLSESVLEILAIISESRERQTGGI